MERLLFWDPLVGVNKREEETHIGSTNIHNEKGGELQYDTRNRMGPVRYDFVFKRYVTILFSIIAICKCSCRTSYICVLLGVPIFFRRN